jgi:parvulin-like peptidyl-prolyl isomerase
MEAIRQRALDGEDFAELASQYSDDDSAETGGSLGAVTRGRMVAPFEEAGFKLKNGEISEVVETEYGFHIIKADTDLVPEQQMTFEAAKTQIDGTLEQERFYDELDRLKEEHPVTYNVEVDPTTGEPSASPDPSQTDSGESTGAESGSTDPGAATE